MNTPISHAQAVGDFCNLPSKFSGLTALRKALLKLAAAVLDLVVSNSPSTWSFGPLRPSYGHRDARTPSTNQACLIPNPAFRSAHFKCSALCPYSIKTRPHFDTREPHFPTKGRHCDRRARTFHADRPPDCLIRSRPRLQDRLSSTPIQEKPSIATSNRGDNTHRAQR